MFGFDEGGRFGNVVDDKCRLCVAVVHRRQRGETFLPSGIPNFEFDGPRGESTFLGEESGWGGRLVRCGEEGKLEPDGGGQRRTANGGLFVFLEVVVDEAEDEGRLNGETG